jgi:hypothetical protein
VLVLHVPWADLDLTVDVKNVVFQRLVVRRFVVRRLVVRRMVGVPDKYKPNPNPNPIYCILPGTSWFCFLDWFQ